MKAPNKIGFQFNAPVNVGQMINEAQTVTQENNYARSYMESGEEDPRTAPIPVKYTAREKAIIQRMAESRGLSVSKFVWEATRFYMSTLGEEMAE